MSKRTSLDQIRTPRIVGERVRPEHGAELIALLRDRRVIPTLWPTLEGPTEAEVLAINDRAIEHWERHGFGIWLLRDAETGAMLGRGGLQHTHVAGRDEVEAGWAIVPERWGDGLATELALTSLDVGFHELGLHEIVAFTLPHNVASRRVMEKSGFTYELDTIHAGLPHVLYRTNAELAQSANAP